MTAIYLLTVLDAKKPKIKVPAHSSPGKGFSPGLWIVTIPLCPHMVGREGALKDLPLLIRHQHYRLMISFNLYSSSTVAHQAPLSMGFSRQEHWSGLPCLPSGHLPNPGIKPISLMPPALMGEFFSPLFKGPISKYSQIRG